MEAHRATPHSQEHDTISGDHEELAAAIEQASAEERNELIGALLLDREKDRATIAAQDDEIRELEAFGRDQNQVIIDLAREARQLTESNRQLTESNKVWRKAAKLLYDKLKRENNDVTRQSVRMQNRLRTVREQAAYDRLTGFKRKEYLAGDVEAQITAMNHGERLSDRAIGALSIIYLDLDGFKVINDTYGHSAGDELLEGFSKSLRTHVRAEDEHGIYRCGGDEFAILLPSMGHSEAVNMGANILDNIANESIATSAGEFKIGMSVGIATLRAGETPLAADELIHRADQAMYRAKKAGGNDIAVYEARSADIA